MSFGLRAAVRGLLLPVSPAREEEYLTEVERQLDELGVDEDRPEWIELQLRRWADEEKPPVELKSMVGSLLFETDRTPPTYMFESLGSTNTSRYLAAAQKLSKEYFELHKKLVTKHLLGHDAARQILSHTALIVKWAVEEHMSASEICRLVVARDGRADLNWKVIQDILKNASGAPEITLEETKKFFAMDDDIEPDLFGDLSLDEATLRVGQIASTLGCTQEIGDWLHDLIVKEPHEPFLPMLHFQLLAQWKYDHAVTYAYEFEPRGQKVKTWLVERYTDAGLPVAQDPYLNNAKALLRFDTAWVAGRSDNLRAATAFARILGALEELGMSAKTELAMQIRGILHRLLRLETQENSGALPELLDPWSKDDIEAVLERLSSSNTQTTGLVEQRVVDCYGLKLHPSSGGWRPRGIGDPVFATNASTKKFGDAEFELPDPIAPKIRAYEPHGGNLTLPYVLDHLNTFRNVLRKRSEALSAIADLEDWSFKVTFVSHNRAANLPLSEKVDGLQVELDYLLFEDVANALDPSADRDLIHENIVDRLNNRFVHPKHRVTIRGWMN